MLQNTPTHDTVAWSVPYIRDELNLKWNNWIPEQHLPTPLEWIDCPRLSTRNTPTPLSLTSTFNQKTSNTLQRASQSPPHPHLQPPTANRRSPLSTSSAQHNLQKEKVKTKAAAQPAQQHGFAIPEEADSGPGFGFDGLSKKQLKALRRAEDQQQDATQPNGAGSWFLKLPERPPSLVLRQKLPLPPIRLASSEEGRLSSGVPSPTNEKVPVNPRS